MKNSARSVWIAVCVVLLTGFACSGNREEAQPAGSASIRAEYDRLRAANAVLRARLSLAKLEEPYLILNVPEKEVRLELQGVVLTRSPIRELRLNRRAQRVSRDTTRIAFCEVPFVLRNDHWYEDTPTLALKDSAAVMSRPDTTGRLVEQIRQARVLALLGFDRDLAIAIDGQIPPTSLRGRLRGWLEDVWPPLRSGSGGSPLQAMRRKEVLVELHMDPGLVRSLAPNLQQGTRLVLQF